MKKPEKLLKFSKKNKLAIIILLILIVPLSIVGVIAFAPFDISNLYIRGNDVIKDFSLDSFNGERLTSGGNAPSLGMKFNVETGGYWIIGEDDITILSTYLSVDKTEVEIRYSVIAKNRINLYTNVRLDDATSKNLDTVKEDFLAGEFAYYGCFGTRPEDILDRWDAYITWTHYDFGADWRTHNARENNFAGDLKASFDINPNPLPPYFEDEEGNVITTTYDYINVYGVVVSDSTHGLMSTDKPVFNITTPVQYDQERVNEESGGEREKDIVGDLNHKWNPRPELLPDVKHDTSDIGILPQPVGTSLNPTTKDGSPTWDPNNPYKSIPDCEFTYSLRALSPLVTKYTSTLVWYQQDLEVQDAWEFGKGWYIHINHDHNDITSETRDVALHVNNRYIQSEIQIEFDIWSKFNISAVEIDELELQTPEEYYDELMWQLLVDGWGGGTTYIEAPTGINFEEIFWIIIILVVIIGGIYVFVQIGVPLIKGKQTIDVIREC